jgi:hypothetical protein
VLSWADCNSMAERFAKQAGEPARWPQERALLLHLSQCWAALGWATELVELHGAAPSLKSDEPGGRAEK